jgi:chromate transport protein ChrA
MDTTAIGICVGLLGVFCYASVKAMRQRSFDLNATILVFLALFSLPGGVHIITAALTGNYSDLPTSWREHVAVAGIAIIGLAIHFVFGIFRSAWPQQANTQQNARSDENEQN